VPHSSFAKESVVGLGPFRLLSDLSLPENHDRDATRCDGDQNSGSSVDGRLPSPVRSTLAASETAPLTGIPPAAQVVDATQYWEIRDIIGKKDVDSKIHYLVDWCPTLVPERSLRSAKELVDEFEARLRTQLKSKNGRRGGLGLKQGERAA
jgi:hypothetical protein